MSGKNKVVEYLAAGYGAVVAQNGIYHAGAVLETAIIADYKAHGHDSVENAAAKAHDSVHKYHVLTYLGRLLLRRIDGDVLEFAGSLDITAGSYFGVLYDLRHFNDAAVSQGAVVTSMMIHGLLGKFLEPLLQRLVVHELGPKIGIRCNHTVKGQYGAAACLVHHMKFHTHILVFTVLDDTVAELGVVCRGHLIHVEQNATVTYDVMTDVVDAMDGAVVAYVTGMDDGVGNSDRKAQVVKLETGIDYPAYADRAHKLVVAHVFRIKLVSNPYRIPTACGVGIADQGCYFSAAQVPPASFRSTGLTVPQIILVLAGRNIFWGNPTVEELLRRQYGNFIQ